MQLRWIERTTYNDGEDEYFKKTEKVLQYYDSANIEGEKYIGWQDVPTVKECQ